MATSLWYSNNQIDAIISDVLPHLDTIKIKNRLLDGSYHIQTIGDPVKNIDIVLYSNETVKELLDSYESSATQVTLKRDGKYYAGLVVDPISWVNAVNGDFNTRLYEGTFTLAVNSEGVDS